MWERKGWHVGQEFFRAILNISNEIYKHNLRKSLVQDSNSGDITKSTFLLEKWKKKKKKNN